MLRCSSSWCISNEHRTSLSDWRLRAIHESSFQPALLELCRREHNHQAVPQVSDPARIMQGVCEVASVKHWSSACGRPDSLAWKRLFHGKRPVHFPIAQRKNRTLREQKVACCVQDAMCDSRWALCVDWLKRHLEAPATVGATVALFVPAGIARIAVLKLSTVMVASSSISMWKVMRPVRVEAAIPDPMRRIV
ncbi:hypothetical protein BAUCODRAFT_177484 [Baudoinia panamericana UAMH 10762]|uniref:Uncharacterized protein n=1 Tax=Baudoinia panamericana (strain UAMH 10762) TaxID=717646 RepID=M2N926_BAUPA|nr:uncharacterized protein BAUCODRAFT_177484 [Baudoinia panamericana UAMH 10762]EMD00659.1 hypothetical protein BAUCODRAFT_177484 [Baudoinia panamericana UAMH 10762]